MKPSSQRTTLRRQQRGAILIFVLIALTLLLVGGVAMVRSMNVTLFNAGNYGFKRDLVNQSERAIEEVYANFGAGPLSAVAARNLALPTSNYSASMLPSNAQGLPNALLDDAAFALVGVAGRDIFVPAQRITIRYVIDRLCATGHVGPADQSVCTMAGTGCTGESSDQQNNACQSSSGGAGANSLQPVYRISVRVTGPRNTESYFQSTFAI